MKKLFALLAVTAIISSCHNEDDSTAHNESFFKLAEGNLWVYERYNVNANGEQLQGLAPDTVKITGQEVINGLSYYKLHHSNIIMSDSNELEYRRVNEAGHLVNEHGLVYHPGKDAQYTYSFNKESFGIINYQLQNPIEQTVSGTNYTLYPYVGYFTPSAQYPDLTAGIGSIIGYQQGIGKVVQKSRYIASADAYIEDRLVYYELN